MFPKPNFSIPDPGSKRFRVQYPNKRIQVFLTQKLFLSFQNYDPRVIPGSGSWFFTHPVSRIPDPGGQKGTGFRISDPDPQYWLQAWMTVYFWSGGAFQESKLAGPHHFKADPDVAFNFNAVRFRILIKVTTVL
jgi:hypothetical protein